MRLTGKRYRPMDRAGKALLTPSFGHNALLYESLTRRLHHGAQAGPSADQCEAEPGAARLGTVGGTGMLSFARGMPARAAAPLLVAVIIVLATLGFCANQAAAQGAVKSVHNDWQVRCDTPPGAQAEQCALIQSVTAEDRANVGLTVIVLKTADHKSRLMRVVAPVGVLLPSGLGLKIDQVDVGRAGFVRCLPNGCVAEVVMDDNLLKQLRTGQTATFIIFQTPEEGIGFPMSLKGFGEGFDKLS
jgi:invasion protein IalB